MIQKTVDTHTLPVFATYKAYDDAYKAYEEKIYHYFYAHAKTPRWGLEREAEFSWRFVEHYHNVHDGVPLESWNFPDGKLSSHSAFGSTLHNSQSQSKNYWARW